MSDYSKYRTYHLKTTSHEFLDERQTHVSYSPSIFLVVFVILFIVMYFQVVFGVGTGFTFTGFLKAIESAPQIPLDWATKLTQFHLDIPFIGPLVNFMVGVISVMVYFSVGIAQLVVYIAFVLGLLTGVV